MALARSSGSRSGCKYVDAPKFCQRGFRQGIQENVLGQFEEPKRKNFTERAGYRSLEGAHSSMRNLIILGMLFQFGCANYSTTKFSYKDASGGLTSVEMPKEIDAVNLKVTFDAKGGNLTLSADKYNSQNIGTIDAGTAHDVQVINAVGAQAAKAVQAGAAGAAKGMAP